MEITGSPPTQHDASKVFLPMCGGPFDGCQSVEPSESLLEVTTLVYWRMEWSGRLAVYRLDRVSRIFKFARVALQDEMVAPDWQI